MHSGSIGNNTIENSIIGNDIKYSNSTVTVLGTLRVKLQPNYIPANATAADVITLTTCLSPVDSASD